MTFLLKFLKVSPEVDQNDINAMVFNIQTDLCRRSSVPPQQKNYFVESGPNAKEIEMGTKAESLELRFRLYLLPSLSIRAV